MAGSPSAAAHSTGGLSSPVPPPRRSTSALLLASLRPEQWSKNLFVFAGLVFGQRMNDVSSVLLTVGAFAVFCALSSAVYLVNDVLDRDGDRLHPIKRFRPVASGALSPTVAIRAASVLGVVGLSSALWLSPPFGAVAVSYLLLLYLYSVFLKHVVIIDVFTIAAGFVLRTLAGVVIVDVPMSGWLFLCTTLLALFLSLNKRRHEITLLANDAGQHRPILSEYDPYLIDQMITIVGAATLIAYGTYATSAETASRLGTPWMALTIPFVLYGLLRYLYLVHRRQGGGSPSSLVMTDRPLLVCVTLWAACIVLLINLGASVRP